MKQPQRGWRMIRDMDLELWLEFRKAAKNKGRTLAGYLEEAMREKLESEKEK